MPHPVPLATADKPRTWEQQMSLEKIGTNVYRSLMGTPFGGFAKMKNGEMRPRAYGGHVYAQAAYAASKTIDHGFMLHSITGYFTVLGLADEAFIYTVSEVRTGKNYAVRNVTVTQNGDPTICFTCLCSFKRSEPHFINVQESHDVKETYRPVLGDLEPEDVPVRNDVTTFQLAAGETAPGITPFFPGLQTSLLPNAIVHRNQHPLDRKHLYFFSANGEPRADPDYNLEACAHLYHSDRESIYSISRAYEMMDVLEHASSLSHTVIFHVPGEELSFHDPQGRKRWFYQETFSKRIGDGRGLHEGRIYRRDGTHVLTLIQDGSFKLQPMSEAERRRRERKLNSPVKL